jgi:hypothetical protein
MLKNTAYVATLMVLASGQIAAQEVTSQVAAQAAQPIFQILSESTVQQRDGSTITFRQVSPLVITPPAVSIPARELTAAQATVLNQMPMKESKLLSISASVKSNGFTVLRWICGASQRLQAVSNVDFRYMEGLASLPTEQADYLLILSAGPDDQAMTEAEAQSAQSLPVNGRASFALIRGHAAASQSDESALDAMDSLLDYFATHRAELVQQRAQREADRVARELAARNAPPQPPKHSIIHFWPLQPAQRDTIQAQAQQEAQRKTQGGQQP